MQATPSLSAAVSSHVRVSLALLPLLACNRASALDGIDDGDNLLKMFAAQENSYPISTWIEGRSACDGEKWEGVKCTSVDGVKRVISVNVEYSNLFGPIDWTAMKAIDTLEVFIAGGNDFTGSLDLTQLPPLMTEFDVQMNLFSGDVDFSKVPQTIMNLELADNKLTGILDLTGIAEIGLLHIDVRNNAFTQFHFPISWPDTLASFMMKPTSGWDADEVCFLRAVESVGLKTDIPDLATQERRVCLETPESVETEESMPQVDVTKGDPGSGAEPVDRSTGGSERSSVPIPLIVGLIVAIVVITAIAILVYSRHKAAQHATPVWQADDVHNGNQLDPLAAAAATAPTMKASSGGGDTAVVNGMSLDEANNERMRRALDGDEGEAVALGDEESLASL